VSLEEDENGLRGVVEYSTDLFRQTTVQRLIGHFESLLDGIVNRPEQRISDLPLLSAAEREQLLVEWQGALTVNERECLHQVFEAKAATQPDAVAVAFGHESLTYAELNQFANQVAHY